jgi:hypothetical protein
VWSFVNIHFLGTEDGCVWWVGVVVELFSCLLFVFVDSFGLLNFFFCHSMWSFTNIGIYILVIMVDLLFSCLFLLVYVIFFFFLVV